MTDDCGERVDSLEVLLRRLAPSLTENALYHLAVFLVGFLLIAVTLNLGRLLIIWIVWTYRLAQFRRKSEPPDAETSDGRDA